MTVKIENLVELQGKLYQKCKVHMLPIYNKENIPTLVLNSTSGNLKQPKDIVNSIYSAKEYIKVGFKCYELYFTSDEDIKLGDYYIRNGFNEVFHGSGWKKEDLKVIASTEKLVDLPQPSQDFLNVFIEEYNKGNIITDVLVEYAINYKADCKIPTKECYKYMTNSYDCAGCSKATYQFKIDKNNTISIKKAKDTFNRADIIHAFTSGHNMAKEGMTHGDALIEYKKRENL